MKSRLDERRSENVYIYIYKFQFVNVPTVTKNWNHKQDNDVCMGES